ncbi:flippase-like domain-containing protein [Solirubrobacter sp. CPCC 204708]|uniref:Lysylphosphatidylglycerol synthase domain-containing protein n=1 Tax=Solirubrobacter deserti TaxID=2282478 RepID=A0ABT4RGM8_9ACTN|nr:lysylphosphatidylglycerol synthase domain-containing protein [Solirubrobacter deserti]MBE2318174.1 flippase-like domain-containing protein [Solirubrobacter deserti]MDA0137455.1 lysylphosphatidylglycerol synthase domain-containing protein [Solirubrobacter deserti]
MRVALVSPYSWTYPGGVTRHIEALRAELDRAGHDVRVFAPFDPDRRLTAALHRGARPQDREVPEWLTPLGPTIGWPSNGAVSNLSPFPSAVSTLRRELRAGGFDVVHLHEPVAPVVAWDALTSVEAPLVGTFHCYSESVPPHKVAALIGARRKLNRLNVQIAVSEAAAWTGRRFYGGRYRIVPNGVALPEGGVPAPRERAAGEPLRIVFVGQAVGRKGLPVLLRAFEALRGQVPAELTVIGLTQAELAPLLVEGEGVTALGRVDDAVKAAVLRDADVLCAPSLGGESFGMVLTEAFAAGTPVVASDIAGYRDVVTAGTDGVLVPRGNATALAETLRDLALDPGRVQRMAQGAAVSAERYAWPRVAEQVVTAYEDARAVPEPSTATQRVAVKLGAVPRDGLPRVGAQRLPSLEPVPERRRGALVRRGAIGLAGLMTVVGAVLAVDHIGPARIGDALVRSSPPWVLFGLALMCLSMLARAVSWHAILKAALPGARPKLADAVQGTTIGVLMSATLPARLGEPSRALIVARRLGRARDRLPVVLGTIVSQTLINVLALVILGAVMFITIGLFAGRQQALVWYALAPIGLLALVLVAPALVRSGRPTRSRWVRQGRQAIARVRSGLVVFRRPREGFVAITMQLGAWALQWVACYVLLVALGLEHKADLGAAAAILFAVNVTAVLPVTPSNVGVFQAACMAVLVGAYGVAPAQALGYGIILQAVEVACAVVMGGPALVKEGLSWREVRLRALHSAPVRLSAPKAPEPAEA